MNLITLPTSSSVYCIVGCLSPTREEEEEEEREVSGF